MADVRRAVEHAGADFAHVDGLANQTKGEFLAAAGRALGFPKWYGGNLDAFADCLDDLDVNPVVLLWDGWGALARADAETFALVLEIASGRAAVVTPPFSLLLRGPGPEIDVPALDA
ncbi:MAG: barstar family protein [Propionibacteriales bacterium]|nr:barstar family protein [Propionibacteriales bacterium]